MAIVYRFNPPTRRRGARRPAQASRRSSPPRAVGAVVIPFPSRPAQRAEERPPAA